MGQAPDPIAGSGASSRSQEWIDQHPEEHALLKRCWDNDPKYQMGPHTEARGSKLDPADAQALSDWVTRTVMNSPVIFWDEDWPPRFWHPDPNENSWWERI